MLTHFTKMNYNIENKINQSVGNNALSFQKKLELNWKAEIVVPSLIYWNLNDIEIWNQIVFEDFDEKWNLVSAVWLKNFVETTIHWIPAIIIDNHNHALYFWYKAFCEWIIAKEIDLIHIDQHSDMNENSNIIDISKEKDLEYIYEFTNYNTNVWNFIIPAQKSWLINNIFQIRTQYSLENINEIVWNLENYILDIDLDFWAPEMYIVDEKLKFEITRKLIKKAKLITIATSPFFIKQKIAIEILFKILK